MSFDDQRARLDRAADAARGVPEGAARTGRLAGQDMKRRFTSGIGLKMVVAFVLLAVLATAGALMAGRVSAAEVSVELVPVSEARIAECPAGWIDTMTGEWVPDEALANREVGSIVECATDELAETD